MAPDGQEQPRRILAHRRATRPADVTRFNPAGRFGQSGASACEGGACTSERVLPSSSGPGGGAVRPVPGLLGEGARGTVREDLGPCPWRGSPGGPGRGVGAHVRPHGAVGQPRSGSAAMLSPRAWRGLTALTQVEGRLPVEEPHPLSRVRTDSRLVSPESLAKPQVYAVIFEPVRQ